MRATTVVVTLAAGLSIGGCGGGHAVTLTEVPVASTWSAPVRIDPGVQGDETPKIAVSRRGEVVAVWRHYAIVGRGYVRSGVHASRFSPGSGWEPVAELPGLVDEDPGGIALDEDGLAIVAGAATHLPHPQPVWTTRSTPGSPWSVLDLVPATPDDASRPLVVLPQPGVAVVAWVATSGRTPLEVWAATHDGSWSRPVRLSQEGRPSRRIALVSDGRGRALVNWSEATEAGAVYANLFQVGQGWAGPLLLAPEGGLTAATFDRVGGALSAWTAAEGVAMSRLSPALDWVPIPLLPRKEAEGVYMAASTSGDAFVGWDEFRDGHTEVWVSRWTRASGWDTPLMLGLGGPVKVVADDDGRGVVLWWNGQSQLLAARYTPRDGWGPVVAVGKGSPLAGMDAGIDAAGNVTAVWSDGDYMWFSRLALSAP